MGIIEQVCLKSEDQTMLLRQIIEGREDIGGALGLHHSTLIFLQGSLY